MRRGEEKMSERAQASRPSGAARAGIEIWGKSRSPARRCLSRGGWASGQVGEWVWRAVQG